MSQVTAGLRPRPVWTSQRAYILASVAGVVGLGNLWRFPYMVGMYGGSAFVLFYLLAVVIIGIPALMTEWTLGRYTRRGTLGAFEKGGLPMGKYVGIFLFFVVICATAYYSNTLGWVGYYGISQLVNTLGGNMDPNKILPPEGGFNLTSFFLRLLARSEFRKGCRYGESVCCATYSVYSRRIRLISSGVGGSTLRTSAG